MKTDIHPEYVECKVHCSCGNEFVTRSTVPTLRVELCSECHPFYTGKQKLVDTGGRVERFQRRAAKAKTEEGVSRPHELDAEPRYMGGQAVLEGVMMRGAVDVGGRGARPRRRDQGRGPRRSRLGRELPQHPVVRGVMGLGESLGLGYRALTWSANQQVPEEDQVSEKAMGWAVGVAVVVFSAIFIVLPALAGNSLKHVVPRLVPRGRRHRCGSRLFIVYLSVIGRLQRHPARVPVPRRRAQGDRRLRERCRAHARGRAAVHAPRTCAAARTSCSP